MSQAWSHLFFQGLAHPSRIPAQRNSRSSNSSRSRCAGPAPARGFTLVELMVACAVAAVLAAVAVPGYQAHWRQAQRADAVAALTQLQQAQEQYRAHHGMYADALPALQGVPQGRSAQGHYRLVLQRLQGEVYTARAEALPDSAQAADTPCTVLTLSVNAGFAQPGPSARCWNR